MCCFVIVAFFLPRIAMFFAWILTDWFMAFETWYWPLLGFLFTPYMTIVYMGAMLNSGRLSGWWLFLFVLAVIADLASWGGSGSSSSESND